MLRGAASVIFLQVLEPSLGGAGVLDGAAREAARYHSENRSLAWKTAQISL